MKISFGNQYYNNLPTPVRGVPSPGGIVGPKPFFFKFDGLGVRVPNIMVSRRARVTTIPLNLISIITFLAKRKKRGGKSSVINFFGL